MIIETIEVGGCRSYILGCTDTHTGAVIDPEISAIERYRGIASQHGLALRYAIDTHTHADHFSAAREIARALNAQVVMSHLSAAPFVDLRLDDGDMLIVGGLRMRAMATPGHTADSTSLLVRDHVFTGDTLLIGGTGRTDLPTGDPDQLYDSLFNKLLKLDPATQIHPAHEYKGRAGSTIGEEIAANPRLQKTDRAEFVAMMRALNIKRADASHRSAARQHERQEIRRPAPVRSFRRRALHGDGRTRATPRQAPERSRRHRRAREGRSSTPATCPARCTCRAASSNCASTTPSPIPPCASSRSANSARSRRSPPPPSAPSASCTPPPSTAA